jgi:hypothetical protein
MTKLTTSEKRTRTRRRNAAKRRRLAAERATTGEERLNADGASNSVMIYKRLLWLAQRRGIPVADVPRVGPAMTIQLKDFCLKHGVSFDWMLTGELPALRDMLRQFAAAGPPRPDTLANLRAKLARLDAEALAIIDKAVWALSPK